METIGKVAIVTGSSKGIGLEIVKDLCKKFKGDVYLTARNEENGKKAVQDLEKLGLKAKFYKLDILDQVNINEFAKFLKDTYGGIDILVNNAAILYQRSDNYPVEKFVNEIIETNFTAQMNISNALFPLLRSNARVVNVSSRLGLLNQISNSDIKAKFRDPNLTIDGLIRLMNDYVEACKNGTDKQLGYPQSSMSSYGMSKVGLNALTRIQQKTIDSDSTRRGIVITCACPGYCKTDMARGGGFLSAKDGAETPVFLSLLPEDWSGPKGSFWAENKNVDWETGGMLTTSLSMVSKKIASFFK